MRYKMEEKDSMARVRDIEIHEVSEDCQPVYQRFSQEYGPFLNQVKVFAHRPPALKHIIGLLLDLADEALLPKRYLEIALVVVSKLNECTYCVAHHAPRLSEQGLSPETVAHMTHPHIESGVLTDMGIEGLGWGLGLAVVVDSDSTLNIDRDGDFWWSGYYGTTFFVSPETGLAGVILSQNQPGPFSGWPVAVHLSQAFAYWGL